MKNNLEAILVCINYSDFLSEIIEQNSKIFDSYIVVTEKEDIETIELCEKYKNNNVICVISENKNKNGAIFNKGALLNDGIKHLKYNEYIMFTDSDCLFPPNLRNFIPFNKLNPNSLYGGYRGFIWDYNDWILFKDGKKETPDNIIDGWGVGFAQIINIQGDISQYYLNNGGLYPESNTCDNVDIQFLKRYHSDIKKVGKLGFVVTHLYGHGLFQNGRRNSRLPELNGKKFNEMPDIRNNLIYK